MRHQMRILQGMKLAGVLAMAPVAAVLGVDLRPPSRGGTIAVMSTAGLAAAGYAAQAAGQSTGAVGVVTALSSLASAVTVVLARLVIRQRVAAHGWVGLATVVAGLGALHIG